MIPVTAATTFGFDAACRLTSVNSAWSLTVARVRRDDLDRGAAERRLLEAGCLDGRHFGEPDERVVVRSSTASVSTSGQFAAGTPNVPKRRPSMSVVIVSGTARRCAASRRLVALASAPMATTLRRFAPALPATAAI